MQPHRLQRALLAIAFVGFALALCAGAGSDVASLKAKLFGGQPHLEGPRPLNLNLPSAVNRAGPGPPQRGGQSLLRQGAGR